MNGNNCNNNIRNSNYYKENVKITKHITVYLNGFRTEKHRIGLDSIKYPKWHNVLNKITNKINPYFGLVKKLYSSESGVTICSFSDVENNGSYVASDSKPFQIIKGGYNKKEEKKRFEHYVSGQLHRKNKLKKLTHVRCDLIVIYVFHNGKEKETPVKIVLSRDELKNWERTLSYIALLIDAPHMTIKGLYNANGNRICGPWEIQHGASYIAVGYNEKFIPRRYKIREDITEIWKDCNPIVNKTKNDQCYHDHRKKSWKQNLNWKCSAVLNSNACNLCPSSRSSKSDGINNSVFNIPSEKYGYFLENFNVQLTSPLHNAYEKKFYKQKYCCNQKKPCFV